VLPDHIHASQQVFAKPGGRKNHSDKTAILALKIETTGRNVKNSEVLILTQKMLHLDQSRNKFIHKNELHKNLCEV